jgi:ubiquinone/menaquinone biosynthesis C-methylase UbiE
MTQGTAMNASDRVVPIKAGYDLWSATYDVYPNSTVAIDDRAFPPLWAHLQNQAVIEIGVGTGRHTRRLLAQGNRVTGIDVSSGMLAKLREKLGPIDQLRLIEGDFLRLDPASLGRFDALVAALVLEHVRDLPSFFQQAAHVLVPGGQVYVSEIHPDRAAQGTLANFTTDDGQAHHLDSVYHPSAAIEAAAAAAGLMDLVRTDSFGDAQLAAANPNWIRHQGKPLTRMWRWRRA